jgi:O-antigen/teichoic acid export membrane protein
MATRPWLDTSEAVATASDSIGVPSMSRSARSPARSHLASVAVFFTGNLGVTAITVAGSLLVTRWTDPYHMGLWNFALVVVTYLSGLQLGVFNGLNRQLPYFSGRGDADRRTQLAGVAYAWAGMLSLASAACVALAAAYFLHRGDLDSLGTSLAIGTVLAASWSFQYLTVSYSAHSQFGRLSRKSMFVALVGLPLTLLVKAFGYTGLLVRAALLALAGSLTLYAGRPLPVRARWDRAMFVELVRIGFPIWLLGQLNALFMTLDRLVLADSPQTLGYYSVAAQFAMMSTMVPTAFSAVLYPQMSRRYGETHVAMDLWRTALQTCAWAALAALGVGVVSCLLIPPFVRIVLPAYVPGIEAAQWASFAGLALALSVFGNVFNVLGRQRTYLLAAAAGVLTFFCTWFALTRMLQRPPATAAAQSMLIGSFATSLCSAGLSLITCRRHDLRDPQSGVRSDAVGT